MNESAAQDAHGDDLLDRDSSQYFSFFLNNEEYGIDILHVQSVQGWEPVTRVPNTPAFVMGVINVRGDVVPIIDLRRRFDMPALELTERTVVILVRFEFRDQERLVGIVVDAVSEVHRIATEDFKKAPQFGKGISSEYVKGLGMRGEKLLILLDADKLLAQGIMSTVLNERQDNAASAA